MKKGWILLLMMGFLTQLFFCRKSTGYASLDLQEGLKRFRQEENAVLLDVRTPEEYEEGHIPHALNLSHEKIREEIKNLIPDKNTPVYIYCRSGKRAKTAAGEMAEMGYGKLYEIGGILDYAGEIEK